MPGGGGRPGGGVRMGADDRVNVVALREITDDSGGRTEIVRDPRDLDPATASIADELSKQYYLGYPSRGYRDGRWHTIRVEVRHPGLNVRARKGYIATS
jgi:D-serine dehydratase